jgi:mannose-6-phosphate isomerase-like protein (cupin superfamily)
MPGATIVKFEDRPKFDRGDGVSTALLFGKDNAPGTVFTSGFTTFPAGRAAPMHHHNCCEQVLIIEGDAEVECAGVRTRLKPMDTSFIPAEVPHRFNNVGSGPLTILWIYGATHVTRTFTETGRTVDHLSPGDKVTV